MSLMAEGTYSGHLVGAKTVVSKGKEVMVVEFRLTHVATGDNWQACPNEPTRSLWMYLTDAARPHTDKKLVALGFNGDFENPSFAETQTNLTCSHEVYQGTPKERWEMADWGGVQGEPIDAAGALRLKAEWEARHSKPAVPSGAPAAPPTSAPPDNIPF